MFGPWRYDPSAYSPALTYRPAAYDLPAEQIRTPRDVTRWTVLLAQKRWATVEVLGGAIRGMLRILQDRRQFTFDPELAYQRVFRRALVERRRCREIGQRLQTMALAKSALEASSSK